MSDAAQDAIDALDDVLDDERAALLVGNLDDVARLHARKERLIAKLVDLDVQSEAQFIPLNQKVERNQALLNAALDGIRSVSRRLATIRRVRQSLDTYDALGRKQTVEVHITGSVEKRA